MHFIAFATTTKISMILQAYFRMWFVSKIPYKKWLLIFGNIGYI